MKITLDELTLYINRRIPIFNLDYTGTTIQIVNQECKYLLWHIVHCSESYSHIISLKQSQIKAVAFMAIKDITKRTY